MENQLFTLEVAKEFQRRMTAIINAVQASVWARGTHSLLGYASDFAFGQERGRQTLVLKTGNRSAYVRLQWDTILGNSAEDRQAVEEAIRSAVNELS